MFTRQSYNDTDVSEDKYLPNKTAEYKGIITKSEVDLGKLILHCKFVGGYTAKFQYDPNHAGGQKAFKITFPPAQINDSDYDKYGNLEVENLQSSSVLCKTKEKEGKYPDKYLSCISRKILAGYTEGTSDDVGDAYEEPPVQKSGIPNVPIKRKEEPQKEFQQYEVDDDLPF